MSTKHRFLTSAARARVRSTPCPNVLSQARLAPRHSALPQAFPPLAREYTAPAIAIQEYEPPHEEPVRAGDEYRNVALEESPRVEAWTSALTTSLNDLADEKVIEVLEEALHISPQDSASRSTTAALAALQSSIPASKSVRSAVSLVTLVLAIRARPTYRHILSTIRPHVFAALLDHLVYDIGAIHLVHLLLNDILTRSFGRLEIVREALEVCCRAYGRESEVEEGKEAEGFGVDKRYILALLEMLDDSYLDPRRTDGSASRQLERTTLRGLLNVISDPSSEHAIDESRLVRIFQGFTADARSNTVPPDIHLAQRTMMHASITRQRKAVQAIHEILLQHRWILDDSSLHRNNTRHYTSLGLSIALIRTANRSLQPLRAMEWTEFAVTHNLVKPHSRLRAAFSEAVDEAFRCVVATRGAAALEEMASVAAWAIASRAAIVDPRVVEGFYGVCDEHEQRGTMRRFVRRLWERAVPKVKTDTTSLDPFLPTGRPLAHLLEYMHRKATPWTGDDARMLDWFLGRFREQPTAFMDSTIIGRCVAAICAFPSGVGIARQVYEKVLEDSEVGLRPRQAWSRGVDAELTRDRVRRALLTDSHAMSRLVKGTTAGPHPDTAFATSVVHRYIQHSPPLAELSETDLARLTGAFFRIGNVEAGLRMLKYLDGSQGLGAKAISALQGAHKMVPSSAGKQYLELLELALDRPKGCEVVVGNRLFKNLIRKGEKALEGVEDKFWMTRLDQLRSGWESRNVVSKTE